MLPGSSTWASMWHVLVSCAQPTDSHNLLSSVESRTRSTVSRMADFPTIPRLIKARARCSSQMLQVTFNDPPVLSVERIRFPPEGRTTQLRVAHTSRFLPGRAVSREAHTQGSKRLPQPTAPGAAV